MPRDVGLRADAFPRSDGALEEALHDGARGPGLAREGERLRRCLGVVNLDEVGTGAERDAIYFESNEVPWNRELLRTFDRVGADYAGRPGFWPEYTTNPSQGGTDSYAFLPRRYKGELASDLEIPATTVYTAAWDHAGHLRRQGHRHRAAASRLPLAASPAAAAAAGRRRGERGDKALRPARAVLRSFNKQITRGYRLFGSAKLSANLSLQGAAGARCAATDLSRERG